MQAISVVEAKRRFSELLRRAAYGNETVIVGSRGRPEVAIIAVAEWERLRAIEDERDARLVEQLIREGGEMYTIVDVIREWLREHPGETIDLPGFESVVEEAGAPERSA